MGASIFYSEGKAHFDSGPTTDNLTDQKLSVYSVYSQNQLAQAWQSLARIGVSRDDSASLGGATVSEFKTDQTQATWQNTFQLGAGSLVAGAEYLQQKIATTNAYAVTKRTIKSVFGGYSADFGPHGVQASVRRDDNSQFGAPTTGSIAYGYRITPEMRVRGAYGTAFHAPSFNELYFPGFGNPDLKPERSRNREIGFDYQTPRQRLGATYFENRISDLIVFVFNPATSSSRPENLSKATIRGTEVSYTARFFETLVRAKLTVQDPKADSTGFQLQRRAEHYGSLVASRAFGSWKVGAEMVASGERFDSNNESAASRLPGYALFNIPVVYRLSPEWSIDVRWDNVANKKYELVQGFNTPGSNVLVSVQWTPLR